MNRSATTSIIHVMPATERRNRLLMGMIQNEPDDNDVGDPFFEGDDYEEHCAEESRMGRFV